MNLKSLEYFVEVARDLNMTTASQRLYISQQALSAQIQKLEQYYGVVLFERLPRLQLTYAGQQLLEGAEKMLQDSVEIANRLSDISKNHAGILRIGIPSFRAQQCFPLILPAFTRKWPNVMISLDESTSTNVLEMICDSLLDVGVVTPSAAEIQNLGDRLDFTFLLEESAYMVCSDELMERHLGAGYEAIKEQAAQGTDLREFRELPFILHRPPMRLRKVEDECFNRAGFKPKVFTETNNTELMIALYPCHLGGFFCRKSRIRSIRQVYSDCSAFPLNYEDELNQSMVYFVRKKTMRPPVHVLEFQHLMQKAWRTLSES